MAKIKPHVRLMRTTARPAVKRRRPYNKAEPAATPAAMPWEKYYAQEQPCRMVELGIKVPGCKGKFTPRGNEVTCSTACTEKA